MSGAVTLGWSFGSVGAMFYLLAIHGQGAPRQFRVLS